MFLPISEICVVVVINAIIVITGITYIIIY